MKFEVDYFCSLNIFHWHVGLLCLGFQALIALAAHSGVTGSLLFFTETDWCCRALVLYFVHLCHLRSHSFISTYLASLTSWAPTVQYMWCKPKILRASFPQWSLLVAHHYMGILLINRTGKLLCFEEWSKIVELIGFGGSGGILTVNTYANS